MQDLWWTHSPRSGRKPLLFPVRKRSRQSCCGGPVAGTGARSITKATAGGVKKVIAKSVENRERIRPLAEQGLDSKEIATRIRLGIGETESFIGMIRTSWP